MLEKLTALLLAIASANLAGSPAPGETSAVKLPDGYIVVPSSLAPGGRYGVTAFDNTLQPEPEEIDDNKLMDLRTGGACGSILNSGALIHMNRGGIQPARWSADSSFMLWEVEGRWSPFCLTLVEVRNSKITSQLDILTEVQKAILARTERSAPSRYAAARAFNKGNGSAFPDGFVVNVRTEGDKARGGPKELIHGLPIKLPLRVHAELTSNPKEFDRIGNAQLDSELDGIVTGSRTLQVVSFRLRDKPFSFATSSSWLEMTDPAAAAKAPMDYGDAVTLRGRVSTRADRAGRRFVVLTLKKPISISASADGPAAPSIREVQLIGLDEWGPGSVHEAEQQRECEVDGTLMWSSHGEDPLPTRVIVSGYGYTYRQ
ncbi:MAG: hypothetical protein JO354_05975 [Verrucomicrobia bacterium]|nr:hypothetical protein [Verrucomicrobiota bacterium]